MNLTSPIPESVARAADLPGDGQAAAVFLRRLAQEATAAAHLAETHPALAPEGS